MKKITEYINNSLKNEKDCKDLYEFKQKKVGEITTRYKELLETGLSDAAVIENIIIGEHPDVAQEYRDFLDKKYKKNSSTFIRNGKKMFLGTVLYYLIVVAVFLGVSFLHNAWSRSWLIIVGAVVVHLGIVSVTALSDKIKNHVARNIGARILCTSFVMLASVFVSLVAMLVFNMKMGYLFVLLGVAFALLVDWVISLIIKSKFATLKLCLYAPAAVTLIYVVLGLCAVIPWHPGWMMIVGTVFVILIAAIIKALVAPAKKEK